jgi:hypothetical protein
VDNYVGLVFSSQSFCFPDGRILAAVFGGDAFIPFAAYRPPFFVRHHMLMIGSPTRTSTGAFKKYFHQLF